MRCRCGHHDRGVQAGTRGIAEGHRLKDRGALARLCVAAHVPLTAGRLAVAALACLVVLVTARPARAHPAPFSFLDLRVSERGVEGTLTVHDLDAAHELGLGDATALLDPATAQRYAAALAGILRERVRLVADGVPLTVAFSELTPIAARQALQFTLATTAARRPGRVSVDARLFPYDPQHQTFVNVYEDDALRYQAILDARRPSLEWYAGTWSGVGAVLATFLPAGVHHVAIGPDHILFLVGLILLGGSAARLGLIATAFTVGHSITLSLAVLGTVSPPAWIVEPAIALSVVLVGVDNLLAGSDPDPRRRDLRVPMAAGFGLIHGFGFASVLREFGLPPGAMGWSLFGFNLGVELGQLALVVPLALGLALIRRQRAVAASRLAMVGSVIVVLAGAFWFVQRVFFSGGLG